MQKYSDKEKSLKTISSRDIQKFCGLQNETFINFDVSEEKNFPLRSSICGITYPTSDYYIKRFPVRGYVLEYVVSGKGYIVVDGKKYCVMAGNSYLLKMGENCEYYADKDFPFKKLWINFYGDFAQDIIYRYELKDSVYLCDLSDLFEKLFELEKISTTLSVIHFKLAGIVTQMLLRLAESSQQTKDASSVARRVYTEIISSINVPFKLEKLSKELFIFKSEIVRHFKKGYGITPYKYLINMRISHAKTMLLNGNYSVAKIAEFLCFSDQYYFSNTFKRIVGMSPLKFRKSAKN